MEKMETLQIKAGRWAQQTFPDATAVEHLKKLQREVIEAIEAPHDISEFADCLLCILISSHKAGFTGAELINAAYEKFEKVQSRTWERQSDGTYQHV